MGHGYGILPITTDVSPMAHAHNQAPGFRLFPRMRLKTAKMGDRTLELWNFQDLPDVRNTPFPDYLTARSALPDIPLAAGYCLRARTADFWRNPTRRADQVSIASKNSPATTNQGIVV